MALLMFVALAQAGSGEGQMATGFTVKRIDGDDFTLSDYRGDKMVHLVFWATWCPVCRAEIPVLKAMQQQHGDDVEILALSVNASDRHIPGYVKQHQLTYPVAIDLSRKVMEAYAVSGTPTQILIDRRGTIVYRGSETPDIASYLDSSNTD